MMHPPRLNLSDFNYHLPIDSIAYTPLDHRDASKLMVIKKDGVHHGHYNQLGTLLPPKAHLVFNNSKVIAARLLFHNKNKGTIEIFLLEPTDGNYAALYQKKTSTWNCLIGGSKKWKHPEVLKKDLTIENHDVSIFAELTEKKSDYAIITFQWNERWRFHEIILAAGNTPLPPYIKRAATPDDLARYQTVFAKQEGSVAAPTAGLHFTDELLKNLQQQGITTSFLTLHVGAGTFKPVTASNIAEHAMHKEFFEVEIETIKQLSEHTGPLIPVGTTSLRTLESLYWIGLKLFHKQITLQAINLLDQWEHFSLMKWEQPQHMMIFEFLFQQMKTSDMKVIHGHTGICITPGYEFKAAKGLITNFHQPQSTLLFIIAALLGNQWKAYYETALQQQYRFLSYGDGMLILM